MAQGTPEIPGFQPLEIRGGGELGIWIEARQVRLDRKVLLKVLPAAESHQEADFLREVQGMVQLDGRGVLRVIEEGQVGKARFVALDEAGGLRPASGDLGGEEVPQLASMLLSLYLDAHELGWRPGRIPVESLRQLPAGGFVVGELGRVTVIDKKDDIETLRAAASETLRRWCRSLSLETQVEPYLEDLRQAGIPLRQLLSQWQLKSLSGAGTTPAMGTWPGSRRSVALGLLLLVAIFLIWVNSAENPVSERAPSSIPGLSEGSQSGRVTETSLEKDTGPSGSSASLEERPRPSGEEVEKNPSREEPAERQPVTPVQWDQLMMVDQHRRAWVQWCEEVDPGSLPGSGVLLTTLSLSESDRSAIEGALLWQESLLFKRSLEEMERFVAQCEVEPAEALLNQVRDRLPEIRLSQLEDALLQARRNLALQEELWTGLLRRALESVLERGKFESLMDGAIQGWLPGTRFDTRKAEFVEELSRIDSLHQSVIRSLRQSSARNATLTIPLKSGSNLKARLLEVESARLVVKPVGRKEPVVLSWSEIDPLWSKEWLTSAEGEPTSSPDPRLILLWGGLEAVEAGEVAPGLSPVLGEAIAITREWRRNQAWQQMEALADSGEETGLRASVEALIQRFGREQWSDSRRRTLEEWWILPQVKIGPTAIGLFPGAARVEWSRQGNSSTSDSGESPRFDLSLLWNSSAGIAADWSGGSKGDLKEARGGGVLIRGGIDLQSRLPFEERVRLLIEGAITVREKPNLNLILWTGSEVPLWFGLGFRPPERSSFTSAGETVLLPAHGIMKVPDMKLPDSDSGEDPLPFPLPVMGPRLTPGQLLQVELLDTPEGSEMSLNGRNVLSFPRKEKPGKGGIAFQTFDSPVMIRAIRVEGTVALSQWRALLLENAQKTLWNRP